MLNGAGGLASIKRWENRYKTPIGGQRIWINQNGKPYKVIKLKDGYVPYSHWLYEQIYGPVPEGYVVRMKDGDNTNVVPENLELITRQEHAKRNSQARQHYPEELKQLIKLNNKLKKAIDATANRKEAPEHA